MSKLLTGKLAVGTENFLLLVGKVAIYGSIYVAYLAIAGLTNPEFFGEIAFLIFIVKGIPLASLGICQGYIYLNFQEGRDYTFEYAATYFFIFLVLLVLLILLGHYNVALLSLCVLPLQIIEPFFRINRRFFVSHYPELILIISFLLMLFFPHHLDDLNGAVLISCLFSILLTGFSFLTLDRHLLLNFISRLWRKSYHIRDAYLIILRGFASYLITLAYFLFLFLDRAGVDHQFGGERLGSLMLAFQFAIGSGLFASILNVTALIDVGGLLKKELSVLKRYLLRRLVIIGSVNLAALFAVLTVVWAFEDKFSKYHDLLYLTTIVGFGMLIYNLFGILSPVAFYFQKQKAILTFFLIPILFLLALNYVDLKMPFLIRETLVYVCFSVSMLGSILYSVLILARENRQLGSKVNEN